MCTVAHRLFAALQDASGEITKSACFALEEYLEGLDGDVLVPFLEPVVVALFHLTSRELCLCRQAACVYDGCVCLWLLRGRAGGVADGWGGTLCILCGAHDAVAACECCGGTGRTGVAVVVAARMCLNVFTHCRIVPHAAPDLIARVWESHCDTYTTTMIRSQCRYIAPPLSGVYRRRRPARCSAELLGHGR